MGQRFKYKMEPLMYLGESEAELLYTFGVEKDFLIMNTKSPYHKVEFRSSLWQGNGMSEDEQKNTNWENLLAACIIKGSIS